MLSVYPDRSTEFHLKSRLAFAEKLLDRGNFADAEMMYKSVLELDSENRIALQGLLNCTLKIRGDADCNPQWQKWDQKLFERALASCPNKKAQAEFVNKLCRMCIASMRKAGKSCSKSENK